MQKLSVFQTLQLFIKQVKELGSQDPVLVNYHALLSKITETKTTAIEVQYNSVVEFLDKNREVLTTVPLALNSYTICWYPLQKLANSKALDIDLLPAFSMATKDQTTILHCHILKLASLVYEDPEIIELLLKMEKTVTIVPVDYERDIVNAMFGMVKEIDVNSFDKNEPEKFVETVMTTKLGSIIPMLKKPGIKWKQLFAYMFEEVDKVGKERGISDPDVDELLSSLKDSDYEVTAIAPKIFEIVKKLRLKLPTGLMDMAQLSIKENEHLPTD